MEQITSNYTLGLVAAITILPCPLLAQESEQKPNIILIMTDQQRFDAMGCVNETVITPNLDKIAKEGNLFSAAYTSTPSSTPARAGLLTGMSPWSHGMLGYGRQAANYEYTMPRMLGEAGYNTLALGKMHFFPQNNKHGFDVVLYDESGRVDDSLFMSDYRKWFNNVAFGQNPDLTGVGWNSHVAKTYSLAEELHPTKWLGDVAVDAIKGYSSDDPLFLKVSFARPHSPYDPPVRLLNMYDTREIPAPIVGDWVPDSWVANNDPNENLNAAIGNFGDDYTKNSRKHYYASITFIDEQIGRIINELKQQQMYDNSLIIFISDHGDMLGDHHLWRKTYAYEGSAAIPFIIKLPKGMERTVKAGDEIEYPVEIRDILPTFLDVSNTKQPEKMDGRSMLPLLQSKSPEWREFIDMEHSTAYWSTNYWMALTDGKIKYVWFRVSGEEQLFDLVSDPYEQKNLVSESKYSQKLKDLRNAMVEHLSVRGDEWVKDGELVLGDKVVVYGDNFPKNLAKTK